MSLCDLVRQGEENDDGEYTFSTGFDVEKGEYQYKFRLGPGDWWVLDETKPTGRQKLARKRESITNKWTIVDDGTGIRNNLLIVESKPQQPQLTKPHEAEVEQRSQSD